MLAASKLYRRDRNHASAIMWSIANEPRTEQNNADNYFRYVVRLKINGLVINL